MAASGDQQINSLTSYRGLAAGMVLLFHMQLFGIIPNDIWIIKSFNSGVGLFFALSGFLFTIIYYRKVRLERQFLATYYLKRVVRIYPLYFTILFLGIIVGNVINIWDVITHVTMIHGYFKVYRFSINGPMWTISIEEAFYIALPFILFLLVIIEEKLCLPTKNKYFNISFLFLFIFVMTFALFVAGKAILFLTGVVDKEWFIRTIFGRFSEFAVGVLGGLLVIKMPESKLVNSKIIGSLIGLLSILIFYSISWICEYNENNLSLQWIKIFYGSSGALLILALSGKSIFKPVFEWKPFVYFGKISYALYLSQYLSINRRKTLLEYVISKLQMMELSPWIIGIIIFTLFTVIAAVFYESVEKPAQKYLRPRIKNIVG